MPKSDICWLCYIVAFLGASFCASLGTVEKWHQRGPVAQWPCPRMRLAFLWRWVCHCYCHSHACLGAMFDECWFFHLLCKPAALQPRLHCLDYCAQAHQSPSRVGSSTRVKGAVIIAYQKKTNLNSSGKKQSIVQNFWRQLRNLWWLTSFLDKVIYIRRFAWNPRPVKNLQKNPKIVILNKLT